MIEDVAARVFAAKPKAQPAEATETAPAAAKTPESVARNVALFFAAPFIGLAYIVAFPFVGAYMIVRMALGKK
jgi:hypothetical protein